MAKTKKPPPWKLVREELEVLAENEGKKVQNAFFGDWAKRTVGSAFEVKHKLLKQDRSSNHFLVMMELIVFQKCCKYCAVSIVLLHSRSNNTLLI